MLAAAAGHEAIAVIAAQLHLSPRHRAQPPVRRDPEAGRQQPGRRRPDRAAEGLAVARMLLEQRGSILLSVVGVGASGQDGCQDRRRSRRCWRGSGRARSRWLWRSCPAICRSGRSALATRRSDELLGGRRGRSAAPGRDARRGLAARRHRRRSFRCSEPTALGRDRRGDRPGSVAPSGGSRSPGLPSGDRAASGSSWSGCWPAISGRARSRA